MRAVQEIAAKENTETRKVDEPLEVRSELGETMDLRIEINKPPTATRETDERVKVRKEIDGSTNDTKENQVASCNAFSFSKHFTVLHAIYETKDKENSVAKSNNRCGIEEANREKEST